MRLGFLFPSLLLAFLAAPAQAASPDDNAHFLAGMSVPYDSSIAPLADMPAWRQHQSAFDVAFTKVEERQLSKVRLWSKANLTSHRPTLFYMFSGPDFLYANSFFPDATTYVLAGLEPPGPIPDVDKLQKPVIPKVLRALQTSLRSILNVSFFITANMQGELRASPVTGTLPVLYVFLARSGKVINEVSLVQIDPDGDVQSQSGPVKKGSTPGAKITFATPGRPEQTLYYFSANLANDGFKASGFSKFLDRLGDGDSFVKSASYLLNGGNFSVLRNLLLQKSKVILQDDTGIPVTLFGPQWQLRPFGRYLTPIPRVFAKQYQPPLAALFRKADPEPIDFSFGYHWRPNESNLLLASKNGVVSHAP